MKLQESISKKIAFPRKGIDFYAVPILIFLAFFLFSWFAIFPFESNFILDKSSIFYFALFIIFLYVLHLNRLCGIGLFICSVILIPSTLGLQRIAYISPSLHIPFYEVMLFVLTFVWLSDRLLKRNMSLPSSLQTFRIFVLLAVWMILIGFVYGNSPFNIILDLREISYFLVLATIIPDYIHSEKDIHRLLKFFAISMVWGAILYYVFYSGMILKPDSVLNELMTIYETAGYRIGYRLTYSIVIVSFLSILILLSFLLAGSKAIIPILLGLIGLMGVVVLSQIRAIYIMIPVATLLIIYKFTKLIKEYMIPIFSFVRFGATIILLLILLWVGWIIAPSGVTWALRERTQTLSSPDKIILNIVSRFYPFLIRSNTNWITWLIGHGWGTRIYIPWFEETAFNPMNRFLDNLWLTMTIKGGILGIVATISFFIAFIRLVNQNIQIDKTLLPVWIALWCFTMLSVILGRIIFFSSIEMILLGLFAGILIKRLKILSK